MSGVVLDRVTKRYGDVVAVDDLSLDVEDEEFLVLLGPSGCGKSTALRMIADGRLPLDKIISHRLPLDDFETGIELGHRGTESLKVTLTP